MKHVVSALITLCALHLFPLYAGDVKVASHEENPLCEALLKREWTRKAPACVQGTCVHLPEQGWMLKVGSINGKELEKPVLVSFNEDVPAAALKEGAARAGIAWVTVPAGAEQNPAGWVCAGGALFASCVDTPDTLADLNDAVAGYYTRRVLLQTGHVIDAMEKLTNETLDSKELVYWGLVNGCLPLETWTDYMRRHEDMAGACEENSKKFQAAMLRLRDRLTPENRRLMAEELKKMGVELEALK